MGKDLKQKQNALNKKDNRKQLKDNSSRVADNRRAKFDYKIEKKIEAGLVLQGSEVKSCRQGRVQLVDSFAQFEKGELFLLKAHIGEYKQGGPFYNHEPQRKRKMLLHKRELKILKASIEQEGYTLIPLKVYFNAKGKAKVELGLAKGKQTSDKRQTTQDREVKRDLDRVKKRTRNDD